MIQLKKDDKETSDWCDSVASVVVDAMADAGLIQLDKFDEAAAIASEEILVRVILDSYPEKLPAKEIIMKDDDNNSNETQISIHIFGVSAALVGVCLTVIGIFRAIGELKNFSTLGDNILAVDALIFLAACFFAYSALRSRDEEKRHKREKIADVLFIIGLSLMAIVCTIIAYTFI